MIRPHHIRPRIAVHERSAKPLRQQASLVDADPAGRAATGHEQVGHDARVVLVPVLQRDVGLEVCPRCSPAGSGQLILVAVVAVFQHPVDTHALVAIIVVIALPERAKRVDGDFVVVAEVVAEHLKVSAVGLAAKHHPFAERFSSVVHDIAEPVLYRIAVFVMHRLARVAEVKIPAAVRADCEGVHGVIVLRRTRLGEERFLSVGLQVAIVVVKNKNIGGAGDDHLAAGPLADHTDAKCTIHIATLIKYRLLVGLAVGVGVFEDEDPVALFSRLFLAAVIEHLTHPDAAPRIDVDVGRAREQWLDREERGREVVGELERVGRRLTGGCQARGQECDQITPGTYAIHALQLLIRQGQPDGHYRGTILPP